MHTLSTKGKMTLMVTLQIQNLNLSFGERDILSDVSFTLDGHSRAALAGANGCGKTTLLKVVTGQIAADSMTLSKTKGICISYLPQSDIVLPDKTVYDIAEEGYERFRLLHEEAERLRGELDEANYEAKLGRVNEIEEKLEEVAYERRRGRIEQILQGLGFHRGDFTRPAREFSGGYQMRIALSRILVEDPDILLLDEPTNYLDIEAIVWLKAYLKAFDGGLMLVSHDVDFLDDTVDTVYELFKGRLTRYSGNYTSYLRQRQAQIEELKRRWEAQQDEIEKTERFIERFRYKATKARQVQSRVTALEKMERIEIPEHLRKLSFSFPPAPHSGNDVLIVEHLAKAYGEHVIFRDLSFIVRKGERLAIAGRNGTGKSTLLRLMAGVDADHGGTIRDGAGLRRGYYAQESEKTLDPANTVLQEVESIADTRDIPRLRKLLGSFLFQGDDVDKRVSVLSGGEKSRLALLKILLHPANLLLLDEPTNHLDINAKDMLLEAVKAYDGTVVFVSHDTHFIKNLATRILYLSDDDQPVFFEGDYDYFEYKLEEKEKAYISKAEPGRREAKVSATAIDHRAQKERRNLAQKLKKEADATLATVASIEDRIRDIDSQMALPEVYSDGARISALVKDKESLEAQVEELNEKWFELSTQLEELGDD